MFVWGFCVYIKYIRVGGKEMIRLKLDNLSYEIIEMRYDKVKFALY